MKKIVIVAAAVAMAFASEAAGIKAVPQVCDGCGGKNNSDCPAVVFKVTGSGKAVVSNTKGDYKEVKSIKIKKGALALVSTCSDVCCYDAGAFFAKIKAGKSTFQLAAAVVPEVWSVFGKNYEKFWGGTVHSGKKGKTYKLDSALFVRTPEAFTDDPDNLIELDGADIKAETLQFAASAFGKMNVKITKEKSGDCGSSECDPVYTPKSYSGWFVAKYECIGEEDCFLCECLATDVAGGTWKATYKSGTKTVSAARKLAGVSGIGGDIIAELDDEAEAEDDADDDE